ncbi:putative membrane-anchored protein [Elusimicrobium simillimum]|uniref:GDYXXLXY domain-containing protein n=1 Tax=Elusimicrobium simillimum TaxID=3143438 RepID=UPI003C6FBA51
MRAKLFLIFSGVIILIFLGMIAQKQYVLAKGKTFYMELAPVDPRSLMQGDYMALNYRINTNTVNPNKKDYVCLILDSKSIGRHLEDLISEKCTGDAVWLKVYKKRYGYRLAPESFFFQEGYAKLYDNAKYAVLKADGKGGVVLKDLAGADLKEIHP